MPHCMLIVADKEPTTLAAVGLALAVVLAAAAPASAQAPAGTGRIVGTVELLRTLSSRKTPLRLYSEYGPTIAGARHPADTNEMQNVVIYVDSAAWTQSDTPSPDRAAIEQVRGTFAPHFLPVLQGSTVAFPNRDPVFHNVFSLSRTRSFDLGRYPRGASRSVRFDKPGTVQVFCHIHSDMSAVVLVLTNPFFAIPNDAGRFSIDSVPAGEYRIVAWHERAGRVVRQVRVLPGQTVAVDFRLPVTDEPRRGH